MTLRDDLNEAADVSAFLSFLLRNGAVPTRTEMSSVEATELALRLRAHATADHEGQIAALRAKLDEARRWIFEHCDRGCDTLPTGGSGDCGDCHSCDASAFLRTLEEP